MEIKNKPSSNEAGWETAFVLGCPLGDVAVGVAEVERNSVVSIAVPPFFFKALMKINRVIRFKLISTSNVISNNVGLTFATRSDLSQSSTELSKYLSEISFFFKVSSQKSNISRTRGNLTSYISFI